MERNQTYYRSSQEEERVILMENKYGIMTEHYEIKVHNMCDSPVSIDAGKYFGVKNATTLV